MRVIEGDSCHKLLAEQKPSLSFDETRDFKVWKKEIRDKFLELTGINNIQKNACELKLEINRQTKQMDGQAFIKMQEKYNR